VDDESLTVNNVKESSLADAIIPTVALIFLIAGAVLLFGLDALGGPIQAALVLSAMVVALILLENGYSWGEIAKVARSALSSITTPILILLAGGALIGTWIVSGTIPTMVYYGIHLLHPAYFYVATLVICSTVSLGIGSSGTSIGTIGVVLIGLAVVIGVSPIITSGAVTSDTYVGDKISPLSETTILTAPLAKVDLYTHIRTMLRTTTPFFLVAAVVFTVVSLCEGTSVHNLDTASAATALGLNIVAADQYIALVLPVRQYRLEFEERGLKAQNLSRAWADAGTVASPLVSWNSCRAFMAATLGIPTALYQPCCIFNIQCACHVAFLGVHRLQDRARQASGRTGTDCVQSLDNRARVCG
jgi:Na+/H+ antiporter NhaC